MNNNLLETLQKHIKDISDFPKKGILFKDITPVFLNPQLVTELVETMAFSVKHLTIDAVAGVESRGFLLGILLAQKLQVPFVLIRKAGKLPGKTLQQSYDLEYGKATIEIQESTLNNIKNVLIHDDVLATGGTALAAKELINTKANVIGYSFLMDLSYLNGNQLLSKDQLPIYSIIKY